MNGRWAYWPIVLLMAVAVYAAANRIGQVIYDRGVRDGVKLATMPAR